MRSRTSGPRRPRIIAEPEARVFVAARRARGPGVCALSFYNINNSITGYTSGFESWFGSCTRGGRRRVSGVHSRLRNDSVRSVSVVCAAALSGRALRSASATMLLHLLNENSILLPDKGLNPRESDRGGLRVLRVLCSKTLCCA